jgi:galactose mutarotase-like enzyme
VSTLASRVEIGRDGLEAAFVPDLAMVGVSLRIRGEELVALPNSLEAYGEHGLATGIPLLFPWANRLGGTTYPASGGTVDVTARRDLLQFDGPLPIHGVIPSLVPLRVVAAGVDAVEAEFDSAASPAVLDVFPFPHSLRVRASVTGSALTVETTLAAAGDVPVPVSFGYHPYFRLPGSPRSEWRLVLPDRRSLVLDARKVPTGASQAATAEDQPLDDRSLDDGFSGLQPSAELAVGDERHRVSVRLEAGYPCAQVYAPARRDLIALEPMTAPADTLRTRTGLRFATAEAPFTARFSIVVS